MPSNQKIVRSSDITNAQQALADAANAMTAAQGSIPAAGSVLQLDQVGGAYQQLNDAKTDIQTALSALGGKPCGGGRPC
jgi:hypothetical protein